MRVLEVRRTLVAALSVFVGSSSESRDIAEVVVSILGSTYPCLGWWDAFPPGSFTLEALQRAARDHRFSVFIALGEDLLLKRHELKSIVRENVLCEFLLFLGVNERARTFLLVDTATAPSLPSDLEGLVHVEFDSTRFRTDPSGALNGPCGELARAIASTHAADLAHARAIEREAMAAHAARELLELADAALLLRDAVDAVQRDTLGAIFDESRFDSVKRAALQRIEDVAQSREERAARAGIAPEFSLLKQAIRATVDRLPFPKDVFAGLDEARTSYNESILGAVPVLLEALDRRRWYEAAQIAQSLRDRASYDAVVQEVTGIAEERLARLRQSYAQWWTDNSRQVRRALSDFQRAIMKAQTNNVLALAQGKSQMAEPGAASS